MRVRLLIAALSLTACLPSGDEDAEGPVTLTVRPASDDLTLEISEDVDATDPAEEAPTEPTSLPTPDPAPSPVPEQAASPVQLKCAADGGRWARAGDVGYVCYQTPRDANRSCRASDDCDGACLAKSRTCAPVTPLMGCHEVLNRSGARETQCRNF